MDKILQMKFGSHLYGTDTPESDLDFKGIYIPTGREIVLHSYKSTISTSRAKAEGERNTKDDVDSEFFSLDRYLGLLMEGQTVALDMLFAPSDCWTIWNQEALYIMHEIHRNRSKLISKNVSAFVGYARQQASKYGIKGSRMYALQQTVGMLSGLPIYDRLGDHLPELNSLVTSCSDFVSLEKTRLVELILLPDTNQVPRPYLHVCGRKMAFTATVKVAQECFGKILAEYGGRAQKANLAGGIDWKALSHAVRVNTEAEELLLTEFITFPRPDRDVLKQIKLGQLPYDQVAEMIEQGLVRLYDAQAKSSLPEVVDRQWADDFIYDVYSRRIK